MSNRDFRLSDLIPEPLTFTDDAYGGDGAVYDVLTADLLSEVDLAALTRLERRAAQAFAQERPEEALSAFNEMIALLIPALPRERLAAIPLAFKTRFLEFWRDQHPAPKAGRGKAAPPTPAPHRQRSHDSSQRTI
jgi:hypothetical protein